jgi:hypothetical protein
MRERREEGVRREGKREGNRKGVYGIGKSEIGPQQVIRNMIFHCRSLGIQKRRSDGYVRKNQNFHISPGNYFWVQSFFSLHGRDA